MSKAFLHIYIEERAMGYEMTERVLSAFPKSTRIVIKHYKDVFNRPSQDSVLQEDAKSLILAVNDGKKIFEASPMCHDYGAGRFYYAESAMNCVFSCDYCFLKGMYGTSNVVIFVNSDDYLNECSKMLEQGPVYLSASFDTDLGALSGFCPWMNIWEEFALNNPGLTLELRTKSVLKDFVAAPNVIYAFTLSAQSITENFEKKTPSLKSRLECINKALDSRASVRLCLDPLIYVKDYEVCYNEFIDEVIENVDLNRVRDISIGTFRISSDYLSALRKACPGSSAVLFPFDREDGFCVYPYELRTRLLGIVKNRLTNEGFGEKLYVMY